MRSKVSRAVVAVSVAAALGLTAACGGGGDESKDAEAKPSAAGDAKGGQDGQDGAGKAALTEAQLKEAALAKGDVKGYKIADMPAEDMPAVPVPANPAACQPLANMFNFTSDPQPKARAGRTVTSEDKLSASVISLALAAHEEGDAEKVMADLRKATETCDGYEHVGNKYTDVEARTAPKQGDEAVAYKLKADIEGAKIPMSFTVVRSGSTLIGFYSMNMLDADKAEVPDAIIDAQVAKLEKAAG
ncbi:hypothetical protein [Streptomyces stelliscabiei]|uniref:hypothetical protein n=1 Tax=Streptomyces stelliscabiei TaxID=146820 RepID=UPI0029A4CE94|nr:hypothetical protein [Streptomyces stelliscabiei]MDX2553928.1 hypothetical protein [Streptomyces stelliscabiei]MDX2612671.1 hypothetical protein [Streptomyces stelliscabiei]MDX2638285.1 hypothetical protein [Streptomyces stelliscabiei]MDX2663756.1 hypothetical protein [Streptomyces stelliscabiei]MDX2715457.1 hypothetical protein [Streptomyces stelliscabiei]